MLHGERGLGCAPRQGRPQRVDPYRGAKPRIDTALNVCS